MMMVMVMVMVMMMMTMMYDDVRWCTMMYDDVLRCTTMYYDVLRCTAMYCDVLRCTMIYDDVRWCTMMYDDVRWCYESQLSSMAKLLIANEVRIGVWGQWLQNGPFWGTSPPMATVVDFGSILRLMYQVAIGWRWGSIPPWSVLRRAFGASGIEGKTMQKWSQSITEQWKN